MGLNGPASGRLSAAIDAHLYSLGPLHGWFDHLIRMLGSGYQQLCIAALVITAIVCAGVLLFGRGR